jgi:ubiquinone/menaquinone biosynthesis C-methylase UbiE
MSGLRIDAATTAKVSAAATYDDCRCNRCGGRLVFPSMRPADDVFIAECIVCQSCGSKFDWVWGVPYLCRFEQTDFPSLMEFAANIEAPPRFAPELMTEWHQLLAAYHVASNKERFLAEADPRKAPYVKPRYNEWLELHTLIAGVERRGAKVLDVGAGAGFDAFAHVLAGADVTALEFSPILAREGRRGLPMMRWIGGCSHALPFANASFDIVFANAAMHHMRDIPASIAEMLRVLKPGGWLITCSDSFRADHTPDMDELNVFNRHTAVLNGVNERLPRFTEFVQALKRLRPHIEPHLFTHYLYRAPQPDGSRADLVEIREWDFDRDLPLLATLSGSILLKVRVVHPTGEPSRVQTVPGISPAELAGKLDSVSNAAAYIVRWAPEEAINRRPSHHDKLQLMNGWLAPERRRRRQGWRRARWFMRRRRSQSSLVFRVHSQQARELEMLVNGLTATTETLPAGAWKRITLPLDTVPPNLPFVVELRLSGSHERFEDDLFDVTGRRFTVSFPRLVASCFSAGARTFQTSGKPLRTS